MPDDVDATNARGSAATSFGGSSVADIERDTARYYDVEEGRDGRPLDPRRVAARDRFIGLVSHRAGPVLEIGTATGRDGVALVDADLDVVGVDLSAGHAARAATRGLTVAVGSARELPLTTRSMGALWTMSTLMHIPSAAIEGAMHEIARVLAPGAVAAIGVWGGPDVEHFGASPVDSADGPRRLFSRRSAGRWRALLDIVGRVDHFEVWHDDSNPSDDAFEYHLAFLTARR